MKYHLLLVMLLLLFQFCAKILYLLKALRLKILDLIDLLLSQTHLLNDLHINYRIDHFVTRCITVALVTLLIIILSHATHSHHRRLRCVFFLRETRNMITLL